MSNLRTSGGTKWLRVDFGKTPLKHKAVHSTSNVGLQYQILLEYSNFYLLLKNRPLHQTFSDILVDQRTEQGIANAVVFHFYLLSPLSFLSILCCSRDVCFLPSFILPHSSLRIFKLLSTLVKPWRSSWRQSCWLRAPPAAQGSQKCGEAQIRRC